ncbi:MAG: ABC transporter permease [Pseudonocardiales bacterium]|nr:ABC transporter permease [Pseudonocardiales bacterium]
MDLLLLGLVIGMANALLAVGLVLVYMSSRILNFAHGEIGAFAVAMLLMLTGRYHWGYWPSLLVALAATALLGALIERTVIQRLFGSPRLIALLATVGVAQVVAVLRLVLPKPIVNGEAALFGGGVSFPVPFDHPTMTFGRVVLGPAHFMILVIGPLLAIGVAVFLRSSIYGLSIRAAAENAPRARLAGIPVRRVSTLAWVISALLAGVAAILLAPIVGFTASEAVGLPLLMHGLAAATIARFESVASAFGWGLVIGLVSQLALFYTGSSGVTEALILVMVLVALMVRPIRNRRTTESEESSWSFAEPIRPLPREIAQHPRWRTLVWSVTAIGALALLLAPQYLTVSGTFLLSSIAAVTVVTLSVTLLTGWSGQLSLGHWALAGVGAVMGSRLIDSYHVPFWLAFALAGVLGGVFALLLGIPALRLPGTLLAVVTLGFAVASEAWLFGQPFIRGPGRLERPAWLTTNATFYFTLGFLAVTVLAVRALQGARIGRNLVAVRDNAAQAAALGIPVVRTRLTGFVVSGVLASLGGFLWSMGAETAAPGAFPALQSLAILSAAIIGGLGSVGGALLGTAYLYGIPYFGNSINRYAGLLATGIGLLMLLLFFPGGLARMAYRGRDWTARWVTGLDPRPDVVPVSAALPEPVLVGR